MATHALIPGGGGHMVALSNPGILAERLETYLLDTKGARRGGW